MSFVEPGPPADVNVYAFAKYILITWKQPEEPNGIITKYQGGCKEYSGSDPKDVIIDMQEAEPSAVRILLGDPIKPETHYVCEIQARTQIGWGKGVRKTTKTVKWAGKLVKKRIIILDDDDDDFFVYNMMEIRQELDKK